MLETIRTNLTSLMNDYREAFISWVVGGSWLAVNFAVLKDATIVLQFAGAAVTFVGVVVATSVSVYKSWRHLRELLAPTQKDV